MYKNSALLDDYYLQILPDDVAIPSIVKTSNKVGGGAYGEVYKSVLGGSEVAVKLRKSKSDDVKQAKLDFENEIKVLRY